MPIGTTWLSKPTPITFATTPAELARESKADDIPTKTPVKSLLLPDASSSFPTNRSMLLEIVCVAAETVTGILLNSMSSTPADFFKASITACDDSCPAAPIARS